MTNRSCRRERQDEKVGNRSRAIAFQVALEGAELQGDSSAWVGLTLIWVFHHLAQQLLPNYHQPKQNWAEGGTTKIQVNPTCRSQSR